MPQRNNDRKDSRKTGQSKSGRKSTASAPQKWTAPTGYFSFAYLAKQGMNMLGSTPTMRFTRGVVTLDFETDMANLRSEFTDQALMILVNDKVIRKWNADQRDSFSQLVWYGAQLLCELKHQWIAINYIPTLTRADTGLGATMVRSSWEGFLSSIIGKIKLPVMSYAIAEFYCKVIQISGDQFESGYPGAFFYPWKPYKTYAELEALVGTIESLYDAAVYATQSVQMLKVLTEQDIYHITEVNLYSHFGNLICKFYPVSDDAAVTFVEIDETTDLVWNQLLGMPEHFSALALMRCDSCADNPQILTITTVAAGKLSLEKAEIGDTAFAAIGDNSGKYDWLTCAATRRSETILPPFTNHEDPFGVMAQNVLPAPGAWDRRTANWLAVKSVAPVLFEASLPVLTDYVSTRFRSGFEGVGSSTSDRARYVTKADTIAGAGIAIENAQSMVSDMLNKVKDAMG